VSLKLLFIDIETTPALVHVWSLFNQNISVDQIVTPTSLLCFAARWHGSKETIFRKSARQEGAEFDRMVNHAHRLLSEADAICHFNGESFDIPRLNQEFLRLRLPPPPPAHQIDLKRVVMSKFSMVSSKLAFVGPYLKIGEKVANDGWPLWIGCMNGDAGSWRKMEEYNRGDVTLLEKLYARMLPWIDRHPNANLFVEEENPVCTHCGSKGLQRRGVQRLTTYVYARFQCTRCGRWSRARLRDKTEPVAARR
jgi:hypothetical protein